MSLVDAVLSQAARHADLTNIISEREHAAPALLLQTSHVRDLRNNLEELDVLLKGMEKVTLHEKKHYEHLRDSTTTRLSYVLIGQADKYQNKTEKEEKAYEQAVEEEYVTRMRRGELMMEVEQAERLEAELMTAVTEHKEAKTELEELYNTVFHGFTAEFPDEHTLEEVARTNYTTHEEMQSELSTETEAHNILVEAAKAMVECLPAMNRAVDIVHSAKHASLEKHEANPKLKKRLDLAERHAARVRIFINQARQWSAKINEIGHLQITDQRKVPSQYPELRSFHHEVRDQHQALMRVKEALEKEVAMMSKRINRMKRELPVLEQIASQTREDLFQLRSTQFMAVLKNPTHFLQAPPSIDDLPSPSTPFASMDIRLITPPPYTK